MLPKLGSIPQYFFEFSDNLREWGACFKSKTDSMSHLELPNDEVLCDVCFVVNVHTV